MKYLFKRFKKPNNPEETLEDIFKEMNEKIPDMNRSISLLKEELTGLRNDRSRVSGEIEKLKTKLKSAAKTGREDLIDSLEKSQKIALSSFDEIKKELKETETAHTKALKAMNKFISSKKNEMRQMLSLIGNNRRNRWHDKCSRIIGKFEFEWSVNDYQSHKKPDEDTLDGNELLQDKIAQGYEKISELKTLTDAITKNDIKKSVKIIIRFSEQILNDIKEKPGDAGRARMFLTYYLNAIVRTVDGYVHLVSQDARSREIIHSIEKAEMVIDKIRYAFEKLLAKIVEYDILNLDAEMKVLEDALRSDELD